jgi:23S rRNA (guanosine2251-2'-O)-methyltransferase
MKEFIYGKNVVREAINANKNIFQLFLSANNKEIIELAKAKRISYKILDNKELNKLVEGLHQGAVAEVESYQYYSLEDIVGGARKKNPLVIILDGLEDPHNLGAIIRTSEAAGVDGIIIPKRRSVGVNNTVAKVSTGALEYVKVSEVTNLNNAISELKKNGYWIVGAEIGDKSQDFREVNYDMPVALVVGSEGKGVSRLVLENCDYIVRIPMFGHVNSLNASVSCAILIYEIIKYRKD